MRVSATATHGTATALAHNLLRAPALLTTHNGSDGGNRMEHTGHLPFSLHSGQDPPPAIAVTGVILVDHCLTHHAKNKHTAMPRNHRCRVGTYSLQLHARDPQFHLSTTRPEGTVPQPAMQKAGAISSNSPGATPQLCSIIQQGQDVIVHL